MLDTMVYVDTRVHHFLYCSLSSTNTFLELLEGVFESKRVMGQAGFFFFFVGVVRLVRSWLSSVDC